MRLVDCALIEILEDRRLLSTTYYVSPTGNDHNAGTDPTAPWATVAKVDGRTFQPGDHILFQRGGQWRESLNAPSSGVSGNPIVYGAYGDANLPKPLFLGSDVLDPAAFTLVSGTTYSLQLPVPINWIYDNHQFTRDAIANLPAGDAASLRSFVETTPGSFTFDDTSATLYVNLGSALAGHTITAAVREDAVFSNGQSFVTFQDLAASETAKMDAGYTFRIEKGNDVSVIDCDASLAGKHHFGDIDSTHFLGRGLTADQSSPDLGFGGASAFVSFSDAINGRQNDTSQWIDCIYTHANGAYPSFISHGDPGAIGSVLLQNITDMNGYGSGITVYRTSDTERVTINGGNIGGGFVQVDTNNSVINGLHVTGQMGSITINGTGTVVQNCLLNGIQPFPAGGFKGGIIDGGHNNTIRFNTIQISVPNGPGITVENDDSNTQIYGNIIDAPQPIRLLFNSGNGAVSSDFNVFGTTSAAAPVIGLGDVNQSESEPLQNWTSLGRDTHSPTGDPQFTSAAAGDFSVQQTSPAVGLYTATPDTSVTTIDTDLLGHARPAGARDAGALEFVPVVAQVSAATTSVQEPATGATAFATFTVTLSQSPSAAVTVNYATSDGTAIAGADYDAATGALTFAPGETSKTINVTVHGVAGTTGDKTFNLNLSNPSANATIATQQVPATITATPGGGTVVPVAFTARTPLAYNDSAGHAVKVLLIGPGSGEASFDPGAAEPSLITLANTTAASLLVVRSTGGATTLHDVDVQSPIGIIAGPSANLAGNLTLSSGARIVLLGDASGQHTINIGASVTPVTLRLGNVSDLSVNSSAAIAAIFASNWIDTNATADTIAAPSIAAISITGAFGAGVSVSGSVNSARVVGAITGGAWNIGGGGRALVAGSTAPTWSATYAGDLGVASILGNFAGSLTASTLRAMVVRGDLSGNVHLTNSTTVQPALGTLNVVGSINGADVRSAGNISVVSAASLVNSVLFAGVNDAMATLPSDTSAFTAPASILLLNVRGAPGVDASFSNSLVSASSIRTAVVHGMHGDAAATPFGISTNQMSIFVDIHPPTAPIVWRSTTGKGTPTWSSNVVLDVFPIAPATETAATT